MSNTSREAIEALRSKHLAPQLRLVLNQQDKMRQRVAAIKAKTRAACRHPAVIEADSSSLDRMRLCLRCGLEEHACTGSGRFYKGCTVEVECAAGYFDGTETRSVLAELPAFYVELDTLFAVRT